MRKNFIYYTGLKKTGLILILILACSFIFNNIKTTAKAQSDEFSSSSIMITQSDSINWQNADTICITPDATLKFDLGANSTTLNDFDFSSYSVMIIANDINKISLIEFFAQSSLRMGIIASTNDTIITELKNLYPYLTGMLIIDTNNYSAIEIRNKVNTANAKAVLLNVENTTKDMVRTLQKLVITVWIAASNYKQVCTAISYGANGIFTSNIQDIIDARKQFQSTFLSPMPIIISHRGLSGLETENNEEYAENTIEAAKAAFYDAGAEILEIDLWKTADNKVVVMHDKDVQRTTNGFGEVESFTSTQLSKLKAGLSDNYKYQIPLLDDYFKEFKDTNFFFFLEIKSESENIIYLIKDLIDQYDMNGKVSFISFNKTQVLRIRENLSEYSVGVLDSSISAVTNFGEYNTNFIKSFTNAYGEYNSAFHGDYTNLNAQGAFNLAKVGITAWPWTYRDSKSYNNDFLSGYSGLTTDYCFWSSNNIIKILSVDTISTNKNNPSKIMGTALTRDNHTINIQLYPLFLENIEKADSSNDLFYATKDTDCKGIFLAYNSDPLFTSISDLLHVKVNSSSTTPPSYYIYFIIGGSILIATAIAIGVIIIIKTKKRRGIK